MSPEAWTFFSLLLTTNAKAIVDLAKVKKNQEDSDPDSGARLERKLDRLVKQVDGMSGSLTEHLSDATVHGAAPVAAPPVQGGRRTRKAPTD